MFRTKSSQRISRRRKSINVICEHEGSEWLGGRGRDGKHVDAEWRKEAVK